MNSLIIEKDIELSKIELPLDETHHLYNGKPLYKDRFENVMSFHIPGIAAVKDKIGAYHINLEGKPIYQQRFHLTFGYYEGLAAVVDDSGWYHINLKGEPSYNERYKWVGNFQEERCPIQLKTGYYLHIKKDGNSAYNEEYKYVGDFKYGIAVVYQQDGKARHIDKSGNFIHEKSFDELGIFHKGFAIAKDHRGAFHINKRGHPIYNARYKWVEPFYNGQAIICNLNGELLIINERGENVHHIFDQTSKRIQRSLKRHLMSMFVGYWKTQILRSIVELQVLELIKEGNDTFHKLLRVSQMPETSLKLIIDFLKVWDFIEIKSERYMVKYLGDLLTEQHPESLKYAALMWGTEHYHVMAELTNALKEYKSQFKKIYGSTIFTYFNDNAERGIVFDKAMKSYSFDYDKLIREYDFSNTHIIMDVGGGTGQLLIKILSENINITKGILFELPSIIEHAKEFINVESIKNKIDFISGDFFEKIPVEVDTIILSRVLHDWNDEKAIKILKNLNSALKEGGKLIILEMVIPDNPEFDLGITLNFNLLVNVGGKERTLSEFRNILEQGNLKLTNIKHDNGPISLIIVEKAR